MLKLIIATIIAGLMSGTTIDIEPQPILVSGCGVPTCIYSDGGVSARGPCRSECAPWVAGAAQTCGQYECKPDGEPSACLWICEQ